MGKRKPSDLGSLSSVLEAEIQIIVFQFDVGTKTIDGTEVRELSPSKPHENMIFSWTALAI
ncbi:hypothetical protein J14TS5_14980 [Paenibacillus lautus]|nr:hypothetical protein J14TS5_14980 [Paenibacillus lautus]